MYHIVGIFIFYKMKKKVYQVLSLDVPLCMCFISCRVYCKIGTYMTHFVVSELIYYVVAMFSVENILHFRISNVLKKSVYFIISRPEPTT